MALQVSQQCYDDDYLNQNNGSTQLYLSVFYYLFHIHVSQRVMYCDCNCSVFISLSPHAGILTLYLPVSITGYVMVGDAVESNILTMLPVNTAVLVAIGMETINIVGTYIISFNPVAQSLEQAFSVPSRKFLSDNNNVDDDGNIIGCSIRE